MNRSMFALVGVIVLAALGLSSVYITDERERALVLQFGQIRAVRTEPGIGFKVPLIQQVVKYDDRILSRDVDPLEVTPADDRRLVVDAFARYRIADVVRFRQAVGSGGIAAAETRIDTILRSRLREVLGSVPSDDILSANRVALTTQIRDNARTEAEALGIEIVDVRLIRTDLPEQNLEATFARMRAEREREAADEIARGNEAAQRIRAQADRTVTETVSDARRQSQIISGEADAQAAGIFAKAYGADPEFFDFWRSLEAYRTAMKQGNTSLVMSPEADFFRYFDSPGAAPGGVEPGDDPGAAPAPAAASGN